MNPYLLSDTLLRRLSQYITFLLYLWSYPLPLLYHYNNLVVISY
nr:MAG TPA: hypothetical protein [Caudoviricetes sp.]